MYTSQYSFFVFGRHRRYDLVSTFVWIINPFINRRCLCVLFLALWLRQSTKTCSHDGSFTPPISFDYWVDSVHLTTLNRPRVLIGPPVSRCNFRFCISSGVPYDTHPAAQNETGRPPQRSLSRQVLHGHHVHPPPARDDRCSVRRGRKHLRGRALSLVEKGKPRDEDATATKTLQDGVVRLAFFGRLLVGKQLSLAGKTSRFKRCTSKSCFLRETRDPQAGPLPSHPYRGFLFFFVGRFR